MPVSINTTELMNLSINQLHGLVKSILDEAHAMPEGDAKQSALALLAKIRRVIACKQRKFSRILF